MAVNVAIMGFGRIGRDVLRGWALRDEKSFNITHIADLKASEKIKEHAHLFKYDSVYRKFPGEVEVVEDGFLVNGNKVTVIDGKLPSEMNWGELGVDIVIESTGAFTEYAKAHGHIEAGAKRLLSLLRQRGEVKTIVMGVNDSEYDSAVHDVISNASCTTNCLAPVTKVILENFGIERGIMTTVHAYTNDQKFTMHYTRI